MASKFEWIKLFSENYIKPLLGNKKFVAFLMCALFGTGVYTAYDLTGNKLQLSTSVSEEKVVVEDIIEPEPAKQPTIIEKTTRPVVNCNGDSRVMRDHVKEFH